MNTGYVMVDFLDIFFLMAIGIGFFLNLYLSFKTAKIAKVAKFIIENYENDLAVLIDSQEEMQQDIIAYQSNMDRKISDVQIGLKALEIGLEKRDNVIFQNHSDLNRSFLELRESLAATKPMKENNWDSFREAFKGPTRNDVNV